MSASEITGDAAAPYISPRPAKPKARVSTPEERAAIVQDREQYLGNHTTNHYHVGKVWAGILGYHLQASMADIPPHIVELMLAAFKLTRAAYKGKFRQDNYDDALNYTSFANESAPRAGGGEK